MPARGDDRVLDVDVDVVPVGDPAWMRSAVLASLARRFSMVWSEKTTPQP